MQRQVRREGTDESVNDRPPTDALPAVFPYSGSDETASSFAPDAPGPETCPVCGGATVDVHGVLDCRDCRWAGRP